SQPPLFSYPWRPPPPMRPVSLLGRPAPNPRAVLAVMLVGRPSGRVGHSLLTPPPRRAPPAVLAPFIYTQIVWVIILGYLVFADLPNRWTLAGAAVVVSSGLYMLYREQKWGPRRWWIGRKADRSAG